MGRLGQRRAVRRLGKGFPSREGHALNEGIAPHLRHQFLQGNLPAAGGIVAYGVERPLLAIENLTATTLRNIIGDLELDQTLTSRALLWRL